ncbi:MAG: flagellar export chaperone FliS [Bryobacteraceae bacterium]|jgi:flagellar protein FliS
MNPYYEQKVLNSDPIELVRLVYQRAISSVGEAREHLRRKRIAERSAAIMRAYAAIHQLMAALQPEVAPELCMRLQGLYLYIQRRLLDANMQQADPPLAEVLSLLTTLAEAWSGVAEELGSKGAHAHEAEKDRWSPPGQKEMATSSSAAHI